MINPTRISANDLQSLGIRRSLVAARAVIDPAAAIEQVVRDLEEEAPDDESVRGSITGAFYELIDYETFFTELRQAMNKRPDSMALAKVREHFMKEFISELLGQRYEDAVSFVDTHFNDEETATFAKSISYRSSPERGKWATWLSKQANLGDFETCIGKERAAPSPNRAARRIGSGFFNGKCPNKQIACLR